MALTLSTKSERIGFKFANNNTDITSANPNTMVIVNDGKLMFNNERLGLTTAEASYLTNAINEKLLKNAKITLTAANNPYEYVKGAPKPTITFTVTLVINDTSTPIYDADGTKKNSVRIKVTKEDDTTQYIILTKNNNNNTYSNTITMNAEASNSAITGFVKGVCTVAEDIYCNITDNDTNYVLALTKPSVTVTQGGLIYAGTIDASGTNADLKTDASRILGVSTFVNYTNNNNKGSMTLTIGAINENNVFTSANNAEVKLTCLNLLSSVTDTQITLSKLDNANSYYGVIVLPNNITLGKFAKASNDGEYNATNTKNNSDSPFILLTSTNFDKCSSSNSQLAIKNCTYNIYRTKNALVDSITIKL